MRLLPFLALILSSCAPYIDLKHGIVSGGTLSSTQGFSGKIKMADGSTATYSMTGVDAATGATNIGNNVVSYGALKFGFKTQDSNNAKDVANHASDNTLSGLKDTNATKVKLQAGAPAVINAKNAAPQ
jgi:hypothetical protein